MNVRTNKSKTLNKTKREETQKKWKRKTHKDNKKESKGKKQHGTPVSC